MFGVAVSIDCDPLNQVVESLLGDRHTPGSIPPLAKWALGGRRSSTELLEAAGVNAADPSDAVTMLLGLELYRDRRTLERFGSCER